MPFLDAIPQVPYFSERFGHDKVGHFIAGGGVGAGTSMLTGSPEAGLLAGLSAGALKELYDKRYPDKHTVDRKDFIATALGALAAYAGEKALDGKPNNFFYDPKTKQFIYRREF